MRNKIHVKITVAIILLFFLVEFSNGQTINVKDPEINSVYIHTDRSVYKSGDMIMFDAFLLKSSSENYKPGTDSLLVALIDEEGLEVASEIVPVSGFSTEGSMELSKYLNEGNYVLVAGTDNMKNLSPGRIFSRILEIRDPKRSFAGVKINLDNSKYKSGDNLKAEILFTDKNNKPASLSYSYTLNGSKGDITEGKGESDKNGKAVLNMSLPDFQTKETLTLLISASVRGADINSGIIIPTEYNSGIPVKLDAGKPPVQKNLSIMLTTDKKEYGKGEEVTGYVTVTNNEDRPLFASLSVSASVFTPMYYPLVSDNIINCSNLISKDNGLDDTWCEILEHMSTNMFSSLRNKSVSNEMLINQDLAEFFGKALLTISRTPGHCFVIESGNNIKKIKRSQVSKTKAGQMGYSADRNIYDIINRMRPFQVVDNKIMFSNVGNYSINFMGGALIVIDGVKRGTDASILATIPITDIAKVNATTNPSELQRYSALNSSGLVEIVTKKGYAAANNSTSAKNAENNTLFWKPDLNTDTSGKTKFTYRNNDEPQEVILTVEGITTDGLAGNRTIHYSVK
jgi:hypothetical protein